MNWLGAGVGFFLASILGALIGGAIHFFLRRHGVDAPPIVGVLAGVAAAIVSRARSGLRGALVASLSVWAAAIAEVLALPTKHGVITDLLSFHDRLGVLRTVLYLVCAALAGLLGSRAFRPSQGVLRSDPVRR